MWVFINVVGRFLNLILCIDYCYWFILRYCCYCEYDLICVLDYMLGWLCEDWEGELGMGGGIGYSVDYVWWFGGGKCSFSVW